MMDDFLEEIAEILEEEAVTASDELESFSSWDSLAALSVVAMADSKFGVNISSQELRRAETVEDLYRIIITKKSS